MNTKCFLFSGKVWIGITGVLLVSALFAEGLGWIFWSLTIASGAIAGYSVVEEQNSIDVDEVKEGGRSIFVEDNPLPSLRPKYSQPESESGYTSILPSNWDESIISLQLSQLRNDRPNLVGHFLESIQERFVLGQDAKTASARTRFIEEQVKQLRLAQEWQSAMDNLVGKGREKTVKSTQFEIEKVEYDTAEQRRIRSLDLTHKELQKEVEIERLRQELRELKNPSPAAPKLTAEEERARNRARVEAKIKRLKTEQQEKVNSMEDMDEQKRWQNMYENEIERAMQELSKYL